MAGRDRGQPVRCVRVLEDSGWDSRGGHQVAVDGGAAEVVSYGDLWIEGEEAAGRDGDPGAEVLTIRCVSGGGDGGGEKLAARSRGYPGIKVDLMKGAGSGGCVEEGHARDDQRLAFRNGVEVNEFLSTVLAGLAAQDDNRVCRAGQRGLYLPCGGGGQPGVDR